MIVGTMSGDPARWRLAALAPWKVLGCSPTRGGTLVPALPLTTVCDLVWCRGAPVFPARCVGCGARPVRTCENGTLFRQPCNRPYRGPIDFRTDDGARPGPASGRCPRRLRLPRRPRGDSAACWRSSARRSRRTAATSIAPPPRTIRPTSSSSRTSSSATPSRVFLMHRTDAGGDPRLHGKASIGVGGHLNPVDEGERCAHGRPAPRVAWRSSRPTGSPTSS